MGDTKQTYAIRLTLENGKQVEGQLVSMGENGAKALKNLGNAATGANGAFSNLSHEAMALAGRFIGPLAVEEALRRTVESLKGIADVGEKIHFTTDRIQELQFAAVASGKSTGAMDQALVTFTSNLGLAQQGLGKFSAVLKDYGIAYKGLSNAEVFANVVQAIHNAKNAQDALTISVKAFGDGPGQELVGLFREGKKGLDDYAEAAHRYGAVIDADLIKKTDEFEKSLKRLGYTIEKNVEGFLAQMIQDLKDLGPALIKLADYFNNIQMGRGNSVRVPYGSHVLGGLHSSALSELRGQLGHGGGESGAGTGEADEARKLSEEIQKQIEGLKFRNRLMVESVDQQELLNELAKHNVDINSENGHKIKALVEEHIALVREQKLSAEIAREFTSELEDAAMNGGKLIDIAQSLGRALEGSLIKSLMQPLTDFGTGLVGDLFKSAGFANGGVMTSDGPLPLRAYRSGGIADRPQMAVFGEGDKNEAYVPLPDGRSIPVTMKGGSASHVQVSLGVNIIDQVGVKATPRMSSDGKSLEILLTDMVGGLIQQGAMDEPMRNRFGVTRSLRGN
jgi:hypothetical protein